MLLLALRIVVVGVHSITIHGGNEQRNNFFFFFCSFFFSFFFFFYTLESWNCKNVVEHVG